MSRLTNPVSLANQKPCAGMSGKLQRLRVTGGKISTADFKTPVQKAGEQKIKSQRAQSLNFLCEGTEAGTEAIDIC